MCSLDRQPMPHLHSRTTTFQRLRARDERFCGLRVFEFLPELGSRQPVDYLRSPHGPNDLGIPFCRLHIAPQNAQWQVFERRKVHHLSPIATKFLQWHSFKRRHVSNIGSSANQNLKRHPGGRIPLLFVIGVRSQHQTLACVETAGGAFSRAWHDLYESRWRADGAQKVEGFWLRVEGCWLRT